MVSDLVLKHGCDEASPWSVPYLITAPPNSLSLIMEHKEERKRIEKKTTANFILRVPNSLRTFSACASSNGAVGPTSSRPGPVVVEIPLEKIRRPLMRTRANDPDKVKDLMDSISQIGLQVPIDVLEVDGVYYGFSGCHRYEAHQRLGVPTIRCKVRRGTKETLRHHLR